MALTKKVAVSLCGVGLSLFAGSGIASAAPDVNAIANSTCTYPQVMAALNQESPEAAGQLNSNILATVWLQKLVASPPDERREMLKQA